MDLCRMWQKDRLLERILAQRKMASRGHSVVLANLPTRTSQESSARYEVSNGQSGSGLRRTRQIIIQGSRRQISEAYCLIVRSEENFPARATLMIAFLCQPPWSW